MNDPICIRATKWWKTKWFVLSGWLPMLRRSHRERMRILADVQVRTGRHHRERANAEIAANKTAIDAICTKFVDSEYTRLASGMYELRIAFDPRQFCVGYTQDELRIIGRHTAMRVEHEIASCKFVKMADDSAFRRRYPDERSYNPFEPNQPFLR